MDDTEYRDIAESLEIGDKITLEAVEFDFIVSEFVRDPNLECLIVFGKKDHYPERGNFTKVMFCGDNPDSKPAIAVDVYAEEDHGNQVGKSTYDEIRDISVVE
ncbi:hypothetical protein [Haloplanus salilacus]|uniref:hypothetical protein n=1 Tax=Haloplanus salilacus TaxID=2949994 RepID=UPI0030CE136E